MLITTVNKNKFEFTVNITNNSNTTLMDLKLLMDYKKTETSMIYPTDIFQDMIEKLTIQRERGHLSYESICTDVPIGNLHPDESATILFKLKKSSLDMTTDALEKLITFKFAQD
ncbi:MAG: hypothetical protein BEN19_08345 [Epulopiscium sp. Nuni2H_MBin003]|nr:MAG: hypothetical protein BEN19_08345 [Epulopiscium sp. Nuni2H_MBin003]